MQGITVNVSSNSKAVAMEFMAAAQDMRDTATMRALNKVADQAKVVGAREVRNAGYNLKISTIKSGIKVHRASKGNLKSRLVVRGRPIPLIEYSARQTSKGVTVSVQKGRKLIGGAFIATMPGGHRGVFVHDERKARRYVKKTKGGRSYTSQLPIRELYGPALPDAMANKVVQDAVLQMINDKFPSILEHEHAWLSRRVKAR